MIRLQQFACLLFAFTITFLAKNTYAWEPMPKPPAAAPLASVTADPKTSDTFWAASAHEIFLADGPSSLFSGWQDAGTLNGSQKIKHLLAPTAQEVFVLTDHTVYLRNQTTDTLKPVFSQPADETGATLLSFAAANWPEPTWFAGTAKGLFISTDQGQTWTPHLSLGHGQPVSFLATAGKFVFIRVENTLYRAKSLKELTPVFRFAETRIDETLNSTAENSEDALPEISFFQPVFITNEDSTQLWLTSPQGIAASTDSGQRWSLLSMSGLTQLPIHALAYAEKEQTLLAASSSRVYAYRAAAQRWSTLPQSFQGSILSLTVRTGSPSIVIAASENGLMSHPLIPEQLFPAGQRLIPPEAEILFQKKIAGEPAPRAVQKAVVRYSNLTNSKIQRWQGESRLRALLPNLSLGRDFSRGNTLDLDRGGTADADRYIAGPDDINRGWSADVSWDLGDFIWSSSQTSIDVRDKLMVDQRRDFLAEAMRIYFERRRLQSEMFYATSSEVRLMDEKQLRYEELTALLDALTGGWFSGELEKSQGHKVKESQR